MEDSTRKALKAVAVGVGATGAIATAMYFLGGREMPKFPPLDDLSKFAKKEAGFGALVGKDSADIPAALLEQFQVYYGKNLYSPAFVFKPRSLDDATFAVHIARTDGTHEQNDTWELREYGWTRVSSYGRGTSDGPDVARLPPDLKAMVDAEIEARWPGSKRI